MNRYPALLILCLSLCQSAAAAEVGLRIRFGMTDEGGQVWDGSVSVAPGVVERVDGWRFQEADKIVEGNGWQASSRAVPVRRMNNPQRKFAKERSDAPGMVDNGVIVLLRDVQEQSVVKVRTKQGDFAFRLADVPYGHVLPQLKGAIDIERVAATRPLASKRDDEVFPAVAVSTDGTAAVAWIAFTATGSGSPTPPSTERPVDFSYLANPPGADRLWLRLQRGGQWLPPIAITAGGGDLYKCAIAFDGRGSPWVFWSENTSWPKQALANFEIFGVQVSGDTVGPKVKLSDAPGSDLSPVAAVDAAGRVWIAWQAAREDGFRIIERHQATDSGWTPERLVSAQRGNCWAPAIATAPDGRVAIAWDTYDKGDYDVWMRETFGAGNLAEPRVVAGSPAYEARPSIAYDRESRLWITWEQSGVAWGKDWAAYDFQGGNLPLYRDRQVQVRVARGSEWLEPAAPVNSGLPGNGFRRGFRDKPLDVPKTVPFREPGLKPEGAPAAAYNSYPRIVCDRAGHIWVFARAREGAYGGVFLGKIGSVWVNYIARYDGTKWNGPTLLPHSDDMLSNWPAVAAHPAGGLLVAHSADNRQHHAAVKGGTFDRDLYVSRLEMPTTAVSLQLRTSSQPPGAPPAPSAATMAERAAIARSHAQRIPYDGRQLVLLRGEFHRHTETSFDGRDDGSLDDMWRYGLDVAGMDWLGNGDHDNGNNEYIWWLTQKTTDAYRLPGRFDPVFAYERSVPYPEGHRNVVFAQRGVRPLFRLARTNPEPVVPAPDTLMLYDYLRHFKGVCASHTSATDMGTDWRNNAPDVEPMVEIYQGERQSYERPGAPRAPSENDALGGYRPLGFINLALKRGYRLAFVSSSDHNSTHTSYAMVYAEDRSREAMLRAMRARHTYGATDNIVADFRCAVNGRDYMMGDDFTTAERPTLRLALHGTAPFAKVTLIKDDKEVRVVQPNEAKFEMTWTDPAPSVGQTSYYYVRGEQSDGEIVWVSPMWITYAPQK